MTRDEIERIRNTCEIGIAIADILVNKTYDFRKVKLDADFFNFLLDAKINLEKIKKEENKQFFILYDAKWHVQLRYSDCYIMDYACKVISYENYYLVKIFGSPFEKVELTYYKNGKLLNFIAKDYGRINAIDDRNFFILTEKDDHYTAIHKRIDSTGTCCANVRILNNIYSDILPVFGKNLDVEFGNLVGWTSGIKENMYLEKRVLYNYKKCVIVVPEYTDAKYDYGYFSNMVDRGDLIRIVNSIVYNGWVSRLQFLIDEDGKLCTDVYDFARDICYLINKYEGSQSEILNSIYEEAMNNLINEVSGKGYSKVRKNN